MSRKLPHPPVDDPPRTRPHQRILQTARDLFRCHGIRGVGVDAIAEAAGTNKMTLYRHFGSKDDLILACLRDAAEDVDMAWSRIEAAHPSDPLARLHAWVRLGADCVLSGNRGCELANASVELAEEDHPARRLVAEFKTAQRQRLVQLCRAAGAAQPDLLADTLWLLLEGARVSRQNVGPEGPSASFVQMSDAVIASFTKQAGFVA